MKNSKFNILILLVGVFFLSTSAIFVKVLNVSADMIAFYRLLFTSIIMLPIFITNKNLRTEIVSLSPKQYLLSGLSGLFLASHYVLWFESLNYTSVASSTVIVTLQPIFAVVAGYFLFKERVGFIGTVGILVSIGGSCFIGWQDFQTSHLALFGDLLALVSAVLITAYFLIGQAVRQKVSVMTYSMLGYISSIVILFIYGVFQQSSFTGYSQKTWILFVCMAIFSTLFGQMLINWVLKWMNTTTVTVAILTEVIWAAVLSTIILNEKITLHQFIGIFIIISGLLIFSYRDKLKLKREEDGSNTPVALTEDV